MWMNALSLFECSRSLQDYLGLVFLFVLLFFVMIVLLMNFCNGNL